MSSLEQRAIQSALAGRRLAEVGGTLADAIDVDVEYEEEDEDRWPEPDMEEYGSETEDEVDAPLARQVAYEEMPPLEQPVFRAIDPAAAAAPVASSAAPASSAAAAAAAASSADHVFLYLSDSDNEKEEEDIRLTGERVTAGPSRSAVPLVKRQMDDDDDAPSNKKARPSPSLPIPVLPPRVMKTEQVSHDSLSSMPIPMLPPINLKTENQLELQSTRRAVDALIRQSLQAFPQPQHPPRVEQSLADDDNVQVFSFNGGGSASAAAAASSSSSPAPAAAAARRNRGAAVNIAWYKLLVAPSDPYGRYMEVVMRIMTEEGGRTIFPSKALAGAAMSAALRDPLNAGTIARQKLLVTRTIQTLVTEVMEWRDAASVDELEAWTRMKGRHVAFYRDAPGPVVQAHLAALAAKTAGRKEKARGVHLDAVRAGAVIDPATDAIHRANTEAMRAIAEVRPAGPAPHRPAPAAAAASSLPPREPVFVYFKMTVPDYNVMKDRRTEQEILVRTRVPAEHEGKQRQPQIRARYRRESAERLAVIFQTADLSNPFFQRRPVQSLTLSKELSPYDWDDADRAEQQSWVKTNEDGVFTRRGWYVKQHPPRFHLPPDVDEVNGLFFVMPMRAQSESVLVNVSVPRVDTVPEAKRVAAGRDAARAILLSVFGSPDDVRRPTAFGAFYIDRKLSVYDWSTLPADEKRSWTFFTSAPGGLVFLRDRAAAAPRPPAALTYPVLRGPSSFAPPAAAAAATSNEQLRALAEAGNANAQEALSMPPLESFVPCDGCGKEIPRSTPRDDDNKRYCAQCKYLNGSGQ